MSYLPLTLVVILIKSSINALDYFENFVQWTDICKARLAVIILKCFLIHLCVVPPYHFIISERKENDEHTFARNSWFGLTLTWLYDLLVVWALDRFLWWFANEVKSITLSVRVDSNHSSYFTTMTLIRWGKLNMCVWYSSSETNRLSCCYAYVLMKLHSYDEYWNWQVEYTH